MQRGISVPDDAAVTGHDDWDIICQDAPIPITSASDEVEKIGARAATMLVDAIKGQPYPVGRASKKNPAQRRGSSMQMMRALQR